MKIAVGSTSARKIETVKRIAEQVFSGESSLEVEGYAAESGVSETPHDEETFIGAKNRAQETLKNTHDVEYAIGLESGLVERYGHMYEEAWCVIQTSDNQEFIGYSSGLKIPDYVLSHMDDLGKPHYEVMRMLVDEHEGVQKDTWSNYSGGMILREVSLEEALRNALIQATAPEKSFYKYKK